MDFGHPDKYIKAWNFASAAHLGQKVPGTALPDITHIGNVAMEVITAVAILPLITTDRCFVLLGYH